MIRTGLIATLSLAATSAAGDFSLVQPIACTLGQDCHVQQMVDHDPTDGASDFRCGSLTYDGHKGTDFALPSLAAQAAGVSVLAAADGVVAGVRDGMPDILQTGETAPDVAGRECGNGVVIRHDDGWETQYCHLAARSISVAGGDLVSAGDPLGRVGLSGQTQFPHLHLSVRKDGQVVDPYDPDGLIICGDPDPDLLWSDIIPAPPGGIISVGFSDAVPSYDAIKAGTATATDLTTGSDALVLWGYLFGSQVGDIVKLTILGPDGRPVFETTDVLDRTQAQLFRAGGRRTPAGGWNPGLHTGRVELFRDGQRKAMLTSEIVLTD
ncbi:M23 family metallopeptidase [Loktanella sp. SALINAS62]|uniref:M23 family metallopeptidase n=1 Tax=Loktanella sp. SALINAS62 TaxID=2706124 RepID=UPI001B8B3CE2|nr:M23 family metallopeptidase [Loktanella sp. SALINAS62]MBS1301312.1 M23 family metallopeptidase [Loktanella sp. SALINAS62]